MDKNRLLFLVAEKPSPVPAGFGNLYAFSGIDCSEEMILRKAEGDEGQGGRYYPGTDMSACFSGSFRGD